MHFYMFYRRVAQITVVQQVDSPDDFEESKWNDEEVQITIGADFIIHLTEDEHTILTYLWVFYITIKGVQAIYCGL